MGERHASKELYSNIPLYSVSGALLSYIGEGKKNFYLKKNLADLSGNGIRLRFETKGGNFPNRPPIKKDNICVVCGANENLSRHHAIPHRFIRGIPDEMKNNRSQDIVSLCIPCHVRYERIADEFEAEACRKFSIPYSNSIEKRPLLNGVEFDASLEEGLKIIFFLKKYGGDMPDKERKRQETILLEQLDKRPELNQFLDGNFTLSTKNTKNRRYGKEVFEIMDEQTIIAFRNVWKKHFVKTMKPQYLPSDYEF